MQYVLTLVLNLEALHEAQHTKKNRSRKKWKQRCKTVVQINE